MGKEKQNEWWAVDELEDREDVRNAKGYSPMRMRRLYVGSRSGAKEMRAEEEKMNEARVKLDLVAPKFYRLAKINNRVAEEYLVAIEQGGKIAGGDSDFDMREMYTIAEAASAMHIAKNTLYLKIRTGKLTSECVGGIERVPGASLIALREREKRN